MPARIVLKGRGNKYRNRKTVVDGINFDSKKEAERYMVLKDMQEKGELDELELQPEFPLLVNGVLVCNYRADFAYWLGGYQQVVEDTKGFRTREYRLKAKLFFALKGFEITEV